MKVSNTFRITTLVCTIVVGSLALLVACDSQAQVPNYCSQEHQVKKEYAKATMQKLNDNVANNREPLQGVTGEDILVVQEAAAILDWEKRAGACTDSNRNKGMPTRRIEKGI
jgi:hypothetical protein